MAITRYSYRNPWRELETFSNRLSRIFDDEVTRSGNSGTTSEWLPAVNVEETAEELVLTAELPGMTEDNIDIELENNVLTIRGEKATRREEGGEDRRFHVWERSYGTFQRAFTLPRTVQPEEITADFEHGVLTVHMPKAAEAKGRRIQIGGGSTKEV